SGALAELAQRRKRRRRHHAEREGTDEGPCRRRQSAGRGFTRPAARGQEAAEKSAGEQTSTMTPVVHAGGAQARGEQRQKPGHDPQAEVGPQRSANAAPPAESDGGAEHAEGHSGGAKRDR